MLAVSTTPAAYQHPIPPNVSNDCLHAATSTVVVPKLDNLVYACRFKVRNCEHDFGLFHTRSRRVLSSGKNPPHVGHSHGRVVVTAWPHSGHSGHSLGIHVTPEPLVHPMGCPDRTHNNKVGNPTVEYCPRHIRKHFERGSWETG
jgi:hypothetical protein